jgi:FixJ family two-component response regulator
MDGYLSKPVQPEELYEAIDSASESNLAQRRKAHEE